MKKLYPILIVSLLFLYGFTNNDKLTINILRDRLVWGTIDTFEIPSDIKSIDTLKLWAEYDKSITLLFRRDSITVLFPVSIDTIPLYNSYFKIADTLIAHNSFEYKGVWTYDSATNKIAIKLEDSIYLEYYYKPIDSFNVNLILAH